MDVTLKIEIKNQEGGSNEQKLINGDSMFYQSMYIQNYELESKQTFELKRLESSNFEAPLVIKQPLLMNCNGNEDFDNFKIVAQKFEFENQKQDQLYKKQTAKKNEKIQRLYKKFILKYRSDQPKVRCNDSFRDFMRRRSSSNIGSNQSEKVDLGVCDLSEVVQLVARKGIISYNSYLNSSYFNNEAMVSYFISLFACESTNKFDFHSSTFCAFDHRLLCIILTTMFPEEFIFPTNILMKKMQVSLFYTFIYNMPQQQYFKCLEDLRRKFNRHWMPKISKIYLFLSKKQVNHQDLFMISKWRKLRSST